MEYQRVLIAGKWRDPENPLGHFNAVNPTNKQLLPENYPVYGEEDILEKFGQEKKPLLN